MIHNGHIGQILAVRIKYLQSSGLIDRDRRSWVNQIQRIGASYCFGDIGIHAYNLLRYLTGLQPMRLSACLNHMFSNRTLDDYGMICIQKKSIVGVCTLQMKGGALCTIIASKVSQGHVNDLTVEIDGSIGSLEWRQENPGVCSDGLSWGTRSWFIAILAYPSRSTRRMEVDSVTRLMSSNPFVCLRVTLKYGIKDRDEVLGLYWGVCQLVWLLL